MLVRRRCTQCDDRGRDRHLVLDSGEMSHGHSKADARNLWLHRAALGNLAKNPELRLRCLASLERWLAQDSFASSRSYLEQWRRMLTEWTDEQIAELILDAEKGQTLRQCSPLGPTLTPQERWRLLRELRDESRSA